MRQRKSVSKRSFNESGLEQVNGLLVFTGKLIGQPDVRKMLVRLRTSRVRHILGGLSLPKKKYRASSNRRRRVGR